MLDIRPIHVGISVNDMDESIKWYEDLFGFTLYSRQRCPELRCEKTFIEKSGFYLELFKYDEALDLPEIRKHPNTDLRQVGTKHVCFHTDDLENLVKRFREKNVEIIFYEMVDDIPTCFVRDNSGVLLEFMQWK